MSTSVQETPTERDRRLARARMRRLRAGGVTPADKARYYAIAALIKTHRAEFDRLVREYHVVNWQAKG